MPLSKGKNLRIGRHSEPGRAYIVTTVTHERRALFSDWRIGRLLVQEMQHVTEQGLAHSHAWVIMPDHLHWLITLKDAQLASVMQAVKARSALAINRRLSHQERVWQEGYHDRALRSDENLRAAARYIVANPIRAGLVKRMRDYVLWDFEWL